MKMTLNQFALTLGAGDKATAEKAAEWAADYKAADPATKKAWWSEFVIHYVMGKRACDEQKARNICAMTRRERKPDDERAVNAGNHFFRFNIALIGVKTKKQGKKNEPQKRHRAPNGLPAAMKPLLESFGKAAILAWLKTVK